MLVASAGAQQNQRRANITGGGNPDSGKCTIEVVVDGVAEVEINGENGVLRNVSGQPPQWRRFECTSRMPNSPANFRFKGIDGRGRQDLIRDPRNGGAVIRIEDSDGGSEGYTFDIMWGGGFDDRTQDRRGQFPDQRGQVAPQYPQVGGGSPQYERGGPQYDRGGRNGGGNRWTTQQAIGACRDDIRQRAAQRYGTPNVTFQNMRVEDNPDRRDWVVGTLTVPRDRQLHQFACSVNFDNGSVRWAQIDPPNGRFGNGGADRSFNSAEAVQNCQSAVESRMRQRGLRTYQFGKIEIDNNPGRNDWVMGNVRSQGQSFDFSCRVDLSTGDVRSADLTRR